jgi:lysyl-tRNA synthetase class 1
VIPRAVDDYLSFVGKFPAEDPAKRLENPSWHIHHGQVSAVRADLSYSLLLNLASAAHAETKAAMWGYISRYAADATPETSPFLDRMVEHALHYYRDFVLPTKRWRAATDTERAALLDLAAVLAALPADSKAEAIQTAVYEVGKRHPFADLKAWFQALYELLLGQTTGPRMGSFIELYGLAETQALITQALERGTEPSHSVL